MPPLNAWASLFTSGGEALSLGHVRVNTFSPCADALGLAPNLRASTCRAVEVCVPLFLYFLVLGSVLAVLFFYAETVMVPQSLPFGAQKIGLPELHKEPTLWIRRHG
jgi:hypothetical protein